jgi:uncharacterized membrane protein YgcG
VSSDSLPGICAIAVCPSVDVLAPGVDAVAGATLGALVPVGMAPAVATAAPFVVGATGLATDLADGGGGGGDAPGISTGGGFTSASGSAVPVSRVSRAASLEA